MCLKLCDNQLMCFLIFLRASLSNYQIKQEMKRQAKQSDVEIVRFLEVSKRFLYKVRKELTVFSGNVSSVRKRKMHSQRLDRRKTSQFVQRRRQNVINSNPGTSMRVIARGTQVFEGTIRKVVQEDIRYKSSVMMRKGHFMSADTR